MIKGLLDCIRALQTDRRLFWAIVLHSRHMTGPLLVFKYYSTTLVLPFELQNIKEISTFWPLSCKQLRLKYVRSLFMKLIFVVKMLHIIRQMSNFLQVDTTSGKMSIDLGSLVSSLLYFFVYVPNFLVDILLVNPNFYKNLNQLLNIMDGITQAYKKDRNQGLSLTWRIFIFNE